MEDMVAAFQEADAWMPAVRQTAGEDQPIWLALALLARAKDVAG